MAARYPGIGPLPSSVVPGRRMYEIRLPTFLQGRHGYPVELLGPSRGRGRPRVGGRGADQEAAFSGERRQGTAGEHTHPGWALQGARSACRTRRCRMGGASAAMGPRRDGGLCYARRASEARFSPNLPRTRCSTGPRRGSIRGAERYAGGGGANRDVRDWALCRLCSPPDPCTPDFEGLPDLPWPPPGPCERRCDPPETGDMLWCEVNCGSLLNPESLPDDDFQRGFGI